MKKAEWWHQPVINVWVIMVQSATIKINDVVTDIEKIMASLFAYTHPVHCAPRMSDSICKILETRLAAHYESKHIFIKLLIIDIVCAPSYDNKVNSARNIVEKSAT